MNTIIKSSLALVLSAIALQVSAQGVVVRKTDGTYHKVSYADLDCIETYTAEEEAAVNALATAFAEGGEYTVQSDATLYEPLVLKAGTNLVLNLNGKKITNQLGNPSTDVIIVEEGATLTINGNGYVEAVSGNDGYPVISKGVVTINGGTFTSGTDAAGAGNACIYARENGKIYITGGEFHSAEGALMINKKDEHRETTVIEITGGSFYGFNPADNGSETSGGGRGHGTNFVVAGYEVVENNDVFTVVKGDGLVLAEELSKGGEYTLSEDVTISVPMELKNVTVVLDLSNYKLSSNGLVNRGVIEVGEGATLTIKGAGTITADSSYPVALKGGTVNIEGGNFLGTNSTQAVYISTGTANISGGYFEVDSEYNGTTYTWTALDKTEYHRYTLNCYDTNYAAGTAVFNVTGGSFKSFNPAYNGAEGIENPVSFVADGYEVTEADGVYTVVKSAE